jgi:hypothetical protein
MWAVWHDKSYDILIGKSEGKRPLTVTKRWWEGSTIMYQQLESTDQGQNSGGVLWMLHWTLGLCEGPGISWVAESLLVLKEDSDSMELCRLLTKTSYGDRAVALQTRHVVEWSTLVLCNRELPVQMSTRRPAVMAEFFVLFLQSFQANAGIVHWN